MRESPTITLTRSTRDGAVDAEFVVPRQLGSVRLQREIGRGGMGVVWLGQDELLSRNVAVKFLLSAAPSPDDPNFGRFIEGARAAAMVRHAALTVVHHADVVANVPYLVMEYVPGASLAAVLRSCGPLDLPAALAVLEQAADSLGELHERGIVHQDVKPANVLLDDAGRAFVTDFGLAHLRTTGGVPQSPAHVAGTPAYMAPEMYAGHTSARSDVYALGIMTYELLCGVLPTRASPDNANAEVVLPTYTLEQRGVAPGVIDVLQRATHADAVYRYKTARHFLRAFQDACPGVGAPALGRRTLARLAARCHDTPEATAGHVTGESTPSSYYEVLASRAAAKRGPTAVPQKLDAPEAPAAPAPMPVVAAGEALAFDLPCAACTYNLRSLRPEGRCPECGEPVATSVHPDRLVFADRRWLRRIVRGQTLFLLAIAVWFISWQAIGVWAFTSKPSVAWHVLRLAIDVFATVLLSVAALQSVSTAFGSGLTRRQRVACWLTRGAAIGYVLLAFVSVARDPALAAWRIWFALPYWLDMLTLRRHEVSTALALLVQVGVWVFLRTLALRIPDLRLARALRIGAWFFAIVSLALLAAAFRRAGDAPPAVTVVIVLAMLIHPLYVLRLTWPARRALKNILRIGVPERSLTASSEACTAPTRSESQHSPPPQPDHCA
jgi:hypothetical protein